MAENSGLSIEATGLSSPETQSFKHSYEFASPVDSIIKNILPEIDAYNADPKETNLFSLEVQKDAGSNKRTLKISPRINSTDNKSPIIELDFSGQDGTLRTDNLAEALMALQDLKEELHPVKDSFGALRTLVGEKAQTLIKSNMSEEDSQAFEDLLEAKAKKIRHEQEVANANKLGGPTTTSPELTAALSRHDEIQTQLQESAEGTNPDQPTTKTAKERDLYFDENKEQLTRELAEVKEAIHELTTELRKRGAGESFLTKVANKLRGLGPNQAELNDIIEGGGLPDWTSPEAISAHRMVTSSEALQQYPKLAIELKGYQDRLRLLAKDLPQSILDDPEKGFPGIFTELYPDGLPADSPKQNPVEEIVEKTTDDSLVKEEPNVGSSTETKTVHEKYPRWIDDPDRKISSLEFAENNKEKIAQTEEIIRTIQSEFKESHPEEYATIFGGEDINPYDILQERIREQGKYSQGLGRKDALAKLVQEKLASQGISAPEFLMTSIYLSRQHEYTKLVEASKAAEAGNEQAFKRRVRRIKNKYGNKAARRAVSSAVGGGEFGSPLFIHEDLSKEMSMTAEETRQNGYQDLRALQIVKDRVLDTWDSEARTRWAQYETDGSVVTLEAESKKLDAVLTRVLTKEKDKLTPKEREILAVIETLQKESVDEALNKFTGLTPEDGETTLKSIARWREEKGVEPYTPLELKQLTLKGLNLRYRRSSPRTTKEIIPVPPQPDFDIYYQVFQEQPDFVPEPVTDSGSEQENELEEENASTTTTDPELAPSLGGDSAMMAGMEDEENDSTTTTDPELAPSLGGDSAMMAGMEDEENDSTTTTVPEDDIDMEDHSIAQTITAKVLAIVGYSPLEMAKLDLSSKLMEENQPPDLLPSMMSRSRRARKESTGSRWEKLKAATSAELTAIKEWAEQLKRPGEYLRRKGRNIFKHNIWRSWYNREYENHSREVLVVAGTHLAEESFFLAREQAKKELYGDGYFTGGELGFTGRLSERFGSPRKIIRAFRDGGISKVLNEGIGSPILGSERAVFKRTLSILDEMRKSGQIVEVAAHEKSDDALLTRFTYESEALIHKAAGENLRILDSTNEQDQALITGIKDVVSRYLKKESGFATRQDFEEKLRLFLHGQVEVQETDELKENLRNVAEAEFFAENMFNFARELETGLAESDHENGLSAIDSAIEQEFAGLEIRLGSAASGARTELSKSNLEKFAEKYPVPGGIINEFVVGAGISAALACISNYPFVSPQSWVRKLGNMFIPIVGGSVAGAAVSGILEKGRLKEELAKHRRDREQGKLFATDASRRQWFEKFMFPVKEATVLNTDLLASFSKDPSSENFELRSFSSANELRSALAKLADVKARIHLSDDTTNPDALIGYSSIANLETERTALDLTVDQIHKQLNTMEADAANQTLFAEATGGATITEFLTTTSSLIEIQYKEGQQAVIDLMQSGAVTVSTELAGALDEVAVAKSNKEIDEEFQKDAFWASVKKGTKVFVTGMVIGEAATELAHHAATVELLDNNTLPENMTPLQWLISETRGLTHHGVVPGSDTLSEQMLGLGTVHIPDNMTLADLDGDGDLDLVDKATNNLVAANIFHADGSFTDDAAEKLQTAGFHFTEAASTLPVFEGTHTVDIGNHHYELPNGVEIVSVGSDGQLNDLSIRLDPSGPVAVIPNALDAHGNLTSGALTELKDKWHIEFSSPTTEHIVGAMQTDAVDLQEIAVGEHAKLLLPEGIQAVDLNADHIPDQLLVTATGQHIDMTIGSDGIPYFPHPEQFDAAGIHNFDHTHLTTSVEQVVVGTTTIPGTEIQYDPEKVGETSVNLRMGWWDNETTGSDKSELGLSWRITDDGHIRISQALGNNPTSSWFPGQQLDMHAVAEDQKLFFQIQLPSDEHHGAGTGWVEKMFKLDHYNDHSAYTELDINDPAVQQFFRIEDGKVIPLFHIGEVVEVQGQTASGNLMVAAISSVAADVPDQTITEFAAIPTTALNLGPTDITNTAGSFTGSVFDHTITAISDGPGVIPPIAIPLSGRRPLESPEPQIDTFKEPDSSKPEQEVPKPSDLPSAKSELLYQTGENNDGIIFEVQPNNSVHLNVIDEGIQLFINGIQIVAEEGKKIQRELKKGEQVKIVRPDQSVEEFTYEGATAIDPDSQSPKYQIFGSTNQE